MEAWKEVILREIDVRSSTTMEVSLVEESGIVVCTKNHVPGSIDDAI